jgi:hypothetical protein
MATWHGLKEEVWGCRRSTRLRRANGADAARTGLERGSKASMEGLVVTVRKENNTGRVERLLARVRRRQLELALQGRYRDSARYARLARRVQRAAAAVAV